MTEPITLFSSRNDLIIDEEVCRWAARFMKATTKAVKLNIRLHGDQEAIDQGDIFVFNHFARFETFIPQYLFYQQRNAYCRSIASSEFFNDDSRFSQFLTQCGAVSNRLPGLLDYLVGEAFRGKKIIVFPEGGMVKNKKVLGPDGHISIYSRTAKSYRKQHQGAAVIATRLYLIRQQIRHAKQQNDSTQLKYWSQLLGITDIDELISLAGKTTRLVPASITFYPMRVSGNFLETGAETFFRGKLSPRLREELLIEGNFLLKKTDMDIRLLEPIVIQQNIRFWEKLFLKKQLSSQIKPHGPERSTLIQRIDHQIQRGVSARIRDQWSTAMYRGITINLSHLASALLFLLLESKQHSMPLKAFLLHLYHLIKKVQKLNLNLHESLTDPHEYRYLPFKAPERLQLWFTTLKSLNLIELTDQTITARDELSESHDFDVVRIKNPAAVYANEIAAIKEIQILLQTLFSEHFNTHELIMDDLKAIQNTARENYSGNSYDELNQLQSQSANSQAFFLPGKSNQRSILLVHGFLASPAEVFALGQQLNQQGFNVLGIRLPGHGTSPWDLRQRDHEEWQQEVLFGFQTLQTISHDISVVGFSTGGLLALDLAASHPEIRRAIAINAPLKFLNKNIIFAPLLADINTLVRKVSPSEGLWLFKENKPEHPEVNYQHIPIRALSELYKLKGAALENIAKNTVSTLIIQGDKDPVVDPESASLLQQSMPNAQVRLIHVDADYHGIIYREHDQAFEEIINFLV
ncbi:MAG: alpha/beta fold hydrolase [bacterium]